MTVIGSPVHNASVLSTCCVLKHWPQRAERVGDFSFCMALKASPQMHVLPSVTAAALVIAHPVQHTSFSPSINKNSPLPSNVFNVFLDESTHWCWIMLYMRISFFTDIQEMCTESGRNEPSYLVMWKDRKPGRKIWVSQGQRSARKTHWP